ncbi:hypothetical protein ACFXJM_24585 [Streptomyces massasporeus]
MGPGVLTAQLDELGLAAKEVRITRETLLGLPDPGHPRRRHRSCRITRPTSRSWRCTAADHPLRARQVCEAMDLAVALDNITNVRVNQ